MNIIFPFKSHGKICFSKRKEGKAEMENDVSIGRPRQSPLGTSEMAAPLFAPAFEALTKTSASPYSYFRSDVGKGYVDLENMPRLR
jgi:hypothetical protein